MKKPNKNKHLDTENTVVFTRRERGGEDKMVKGDGQKLPFGSEHAVIYTEVEI